MRILALDPATVCGWAYTRPGLPPASGTWDLSTRRDESGGMKLLRLEAKLIEVANVGVDLCVYESPALHTYPLALVAHAKLIGVIERFCEERKINWRAYPPTTIKKFATGKGNAKKEAMVEAINRRWILGAPVVDHNEADAIALLYLAAGEFAADSKNYVSSNI